MESIIDLLHLFLCVLCLAAQSCPTPERKNCSPPGSSVHGILQDRMLERVALSSSRGSPNPGIFESVSLASPALAGGCFTTEPQESTHLFLEDGNSVAERENKWTDSKTQIPDLA